MTRHRKLSTTLMFLTATALAGVLVISAPALAGPGGTPGPNPDAPGQIKKDDAHPPLVTKEQGNFFVGGTRNASGRLVGQMYVEYQVPQNPKKIPIVLIHGGGQIGVGWNQTPDGREGWRQYFLRKGYTVYVVDQPGRVAHPTIPIWEPSTMPLTCCGFKCCSRHPSVFPTCGPPRTSTRVG